ncbi:MAG: hypothetical protein K2V38_16685 [Gemmataceae bacterium]|nr:hypothetical protein [Gemmataceae bacterium]
MCVSESAGEQTVVQLAVAVLVFGLLGSALAMTVAPLAGLVGLAVVLVAGAAMGLVWRAAARGGRRFLTDGGTGFVLAVRDQEIAIDDREVTGVGSRVLLEFVRGRPVSAARVGVLLTSNPDAPEIPIRYSFDPATDPLATLFGRLTAHIAASARAALKAGRTFDGAGWALTDRGLVIGRGGRRTVDFDRLTAVEVVDRRVCVWVRGEPDPIARFSEAGVNAAVLVEVLTERIIPGTEEGLGRLLFERDQRASVAVVALVWLVALAMTAGGVKFIVSNRGPEAGIGGILVAAVVLAAATYLFRGVMLRAYTNGLRLVQPLGVQEVTFDEVTGFTYSTVRRYERALGNDFYADTLIRLAIDTRERGTVKYEFRTKTRDAAVDALRDRMAGRVADGWHQALLAGENRPWAGGVTFTRQGLVLPGRGVVPYERIVGAPVNGRSCSIVGVSEGKLAVLSCDEPNFYPGFDLLTRLTPGGEKMGA